MLLQTVDSCKESLQEDKKVFDINNNILYYEQKIFAKNKSIYEPGGYNDCYMPKTYPETTRKIDV